MFDVYIQLSVIEDHEVGANSICVIKFSKYKIQVFEFGKRVE